MRTIIISHHQRNVRNIIFLARQYTRKEDSKIPLNEMSGFVGELRSNTQDKGEYTMEYARYSSAPISSREKLAEKMKEDKKISNPELENMLKEMIESQKKKINDWNTRSMKVDQKMRNIQLIVGAIFVVLWWSDPDFLKASIKWNFPENDNR